MSNVVTCGCGKKLRLPEGSTAKAVRCPGCQAVVRVDGATTPAKPPATKPSAPPAPPPTKPAAPPGPKPVPPPKGAVATAPVPPAPKPAAPSSRLIQDPPNVWLYVTDPELIAQADDGGRRQTSLKTYGPADDPLAELEIKGADDIRAYLGKQEYIAWVGRPSDKHAGEKNWVAYVLGGIFTLIGLTIAGVGLIVPMPHFALRIILPIFGLVFAAFGVATLVLMGRGARVVEGIGTNFGAIYLLTNRRAIVWVSKSAVRSFTGPMVMNMRRSVEMEHEDEDFGSLLFTHGMEGDAAGPGFCNVEKVSEVEELVRGCLIDRVLEKSAAGDGPRLVPMEGPNPFARDAGKKEKGPPKKLELWQSAALAMELEKELSPEMIAAAREHTDKVLGESKLSDAEADTVRDELQPGETIVWVGKPDQAIVRGGAWFMSIAMFVFIALACVVLTVVWFVTNPARDMGGVIFYGLAGVAVVAGTVWASLYPTYRAWKAGRTIYVLTSRRALTWPANWMGTPTLEAYGPRDLSNLHVVGKDVVFRTVTTVRRDKQGTHATTQNFGFLAQPDALALERLIRETLVEPFLEKAYE